MHRPIIAGYRLLIMGTRVGTHGTVPLTQRGRAALAPRGASGPDVAGKITAVRADADLIQIVELMVD